MLSMLSDALANTLYQNMKYFGLDIDWIEKKEQSNLDNISFNIVSRSLYSTYI